MTGTRKLLRRRRFETGSAIGSIAIVPNSERLQIARSTTPNTDKVNTALTFTINNFGDLTTTGLLPE